MRITNYHDSSSWTWQPFVVADNDMPLDEMGGTQIKSKQSINQSTHIFM